MAHMLSISSLIGPPALFSQELGGVGVTALALANAAA